MIGTWKRATLYALSYLSLLGSTSGAFAQSVALTFDDGLDPTKTEAAQWNKALLHALSAAKVQAMLIPAAKNVDSEAGRNLARAWGESGHWIGNHSYSHTNFGSERTAVSDFIADIERAEQILSPLPGWQPFFRFPYLKEGTTAATTTPYRTRS
jgi:peptidoglycan-N-acetylglucosamine deacetylase